MKLFYCILAYNESKLLSRIVQKLNTENTFFIIHIQKSVDVEIFKKEFSNDLLENKVFFIDDRIETIWGDVTCIQASLKCFQKAIELNKENEKAYCVLMSGSDYPVKSNEYILNYFNKNYPSDFYSFCLEKNCSKGKFKKVLNQNIKNYWFSFEKTKLKIEVSPFKFIRPRCFKNQKINLNLIFLILKNVPSYVKSFLKKKQVLNLEWGGSETWMQLSIKTVQWLLDFLNENPEYLSFAKKMHNPEEILLQSILYTKRKNQYFPTLVDTSARTIKMNGGGLDLTNENLDFVKSSLENPNYLFCRKFSEKTNELLDFIDSYITKK